MINPKVIENAKIFRIVPTMDMIKAEFKMVDELRAEVEEDTQEDW